MLAGASTPAECGAAPTDLIKSQTSLLNSLFWSKQIRALPPGMAKHADLIQLEVSVKQNSKS